MCLEYVIKTPINVYVLCKLSATPLNLQRSELTKPANVASQAPRDYAPAQHFALIYMDQYGTIRHEVSPSIVHCRDTILSPQVTAEFLKAVANSTEVDLQSSSLESASSQLFPDHLGSYDSRDSRFPKGMQLEGHAVPTKYGYHSLSTLWPGHDIATPAISKDKVFLKVISCMQKHSLELQEAILFIKDTKLLRRYYEKVFHNIQQTNCRVLAKAYVKFVEPHKQVNYPYNGRKTVAGEIQELSSEQSKPPWWPPQVRHREPDHLLKAGNKTLCCA